MLSRLSLKYQFLLISLVTMLIAVGLGGLAIKLAQDFSTVVDEDRLGIELVRDSTLADMYHDGMRALVYRALYAAAEAPDHGAEVRKETEEMAAAFRATFAKLREEAPRDEAILTRLGALSEPIDKYLVIAQKIVELAPQDRVAAAGELQTFNELFEKLEETLEQATTALADHTKAAQEVANTKRERFGWLAMGGTLLAVLIAVGTYLMTRATLVGPLSRMISALLALSKGDVGQDVDVGRRRDEIGALSLAIGGLRESVVASQSASEERSRMRRDAEARRERAMITLADDFERSIGPIIDEAAHSSEQMHRGAQTLARSVESAQEETRKVAASASEANVNVQAVASTGEELTSSISEISRQVAQSSMLSGQAVGEANSMDARIKGLTTAAQEIGEVVSMISDIAGQTNLLALNATIEAARAGEAGKGFAVVASEVKALASQTTKATEEISAKIRTIQEATQGSVQAIHSIGGTIGGMSTIAQAIAAAVEEQGAATAEIARSTHRVAEGVSQVASSISSVSAAGGRTLENAGDIVSSAQSLSQKSELLRQEVRAFLQRVRSERGTEQA